MPPSDLLERTFPGDGEMARLCRQHDWAATPLGPVARWDAALRTTVSTLLASRFPMLLFWGEELVQFYNDAFRPSLGDAVRHPQGLGAHAPDAWASMWERIGPVIEGVLDGAPARLIEDEPLPIERDGGVHRSYWTYSHSAVLADDGSIGGVLVVCRETTPEVESREEVKAAARRHETVLESITDAFFALDRQWRFTFVNETAERVLQKRRGELLGRRLLDAFPEAEGSRFHRAYEEALATGRSRSVEAFYPPLDAWFDVVAYPSDDGLAVYFRDVTERRLMEERLQEGQRLVRIAGEAARVGGWSVDLPTGKVRWSDEACAIHGVPPGTSPTLDEALDFFVGDSRRLLERVFRRCAETGEPYDVEAELRTAGGERVWVRALGEGVRDHDGAVRAVEGAIQDIRPLKDAAAELARSRERFRELAEAMPLIVWYADADGAVHFPTDAVMDFTGREAAAMVGEGWLDVVHPGDRDRVRQRWAHAVTSGERYQVEFRLRRRDGVYRWHLTQARPTRGPNGEIREWYGAALEIHELREVKEEAEDLARRLETTLQSITDAFYLIDREWRFRFLNDEAERILETTREARLGTRIWESFPATVGTDLEREYRRAMETGETASFRYFYPPLDRWFDIRAYPSSEGLAVYFRDITAEREREERLRDQAELLDRAHDAIVVRDLEHRITFWNRGAERLYGWTAEHAVGRRSTDLLHTDLDAFERAHAVLMDDGEWTGEFEHRRHDGSTATVETSWTLVRDDEGAPDRVLSISTDVTERRQLMAQFLRAQRMQSIGTLAGGIAHDLNNVLSPVLMAVEMLRDAVDDEDALDTLDTVEASAERGAALVRQVLAYARGVDGTRVAVDVNEVGEAVARVVRDTFPRNLTLEARLDDATPAVIGDPTQIHQLLMNLVVNARDAMPRGGRLDLGIAPVTVDASFAAMSGSASPGTYVRIEVVDQGVGIPPDDLERIFEPFFTTKEFGQGTGLGLSTVDAIVRSHRGFVNIYSEPGAGTTIRVYLPAGDGLRPDRTGDEVRPGAPRGSGELVLVVEDEATVRDITCKTLERLGYRVLAAGDGAEAVALYGRRGDEVALVITDLMMPIMDGPATIRALRRMDPDVRIIAASGLGAQRGAVRSDELDIDNFLPKPFNAETLATVVRDVLADAPRSGRTDPPPGDG
jgi:PAS domain S-box-containing protein